MHQHINVGDYIIGICDHINQVQSEFKEAELSLNSIRKGSHKVFKYVTT